MVAEFNRLTTPAEIRGNAAFRDSVVDTPEVLR
jgi:hypothetical protein